MKTKLCFIMAVILCMVFLTSQPVFADSEPPALPPDAGEIADSQTPEPADSPALEPLPADDQSEHPPLVVILDENDAVQDMASVQSAGIISTADPYFKVGTITYRFLVNCAPFPDSATSICAESPTPIQAAIDFIRDNTDKMPTDGKIYIEKDTYSDTVAVDASSYASLASLKGLVGVADINGVFPTINGSITVLGTSTGFTLSGFTVNNAVVFGNNTGNLLLQDLLVSNTNGIGLDVYNHTGNVSLLRVSAKDNKYKGVEINNENSGSVSIKDSQVTGCGAGNTSFGMKVSTNGPVTIDGLVASGNTLQGLWVQGFSRLSIKNAVFSNNTDDGAYLLSTRPAPVTLENIYASKNNRAGVNLRTDGGSVIIKNIQANYNNNPSGYAGLQISNNLGTVMAPVSIFSSRFNNNNSDGLAVISKGNITLTNVSAMDNGARGVTLQNFEGTGSVVIKSSLIGDYYDFSRNGATGIDIQTAGAVTVSNVFANDTRNGYSGMSVLSNTAPSDKPVTISRAWFNDNGAGLGVNARGTITIIDVSASGNTENYGISLTNTDGMGNIILKSSTAAAIMNFDDNKWNGIRIRTNGSVLVSNITANHNGLLGQNGIDINNDDGNTANAPKPVTLAKADVNFNGAYGLYVVSEGLVTLTDVSASDNGASGAQFDGAYLGTAGGVTVKTSSASRFAEFSRNPAVGLRISAKGTVTLANLGANDNGFISGFGTHGIMIENRAAAGNILVTNVSASRNGIGADGSGLYIYHEVPGLGGNVTVRSSSPSVYYAFDGNGRYGLDINTQGAVAVSNIITNSGNGYSGIYIDNQRLQNNRPISVTRAILQGNLNTGLSIRANSAVTLENIEAINNSQQGVLVNACWYDGISSCRANGAVTLKGTRNIFSTNTGTGLDITASGNVTLANFVAQNNTGAGIAVVNDIGASTGNVQVTASATVLNLVKNNGSSGGMNVTSKGAISVARVLAEGNGLYGIQLDNYASPARLALTVNNVYANRNAQDGLTLKTQGNLSLSNIQAVANDLNRADTNYFSGVTVNYGMPVKALNLTISGVNYLANNSLYGLNAYTNGLVTISGLTLDSNGNPVTGAGMYLESAGAGKAVLLTNVTAMNNYLNGVHLISQGAVTVRSSHFSNNTNNGLWVQANGNPLTVQSSFFLRNAIYGIYMGSFTPFTNIANVYLANPAGNWYLP